MTRLSSSSFFSGSLPVAVISDGNGFLGFSLSFALLKKKLKVVGLGDWRSKSGVIDKVLTDHNFCQTNNEAITKASLDCVEQPVLFPCCVSSRFFLIPVQLS